MRIGRCFEERAGREKKLVLLLTIIAEINLAVCDLFLNEVMA